MTEEERERVSEERSDTMRRRTILNEGFFVHLQLLLDLFGVLGQIDILGMRSVVR